MHKNKKLIYILLFIASLSEAINTGNLNDKTYKDFIFQYGPEVNFQIDYQTGPGILISWENLQKEFYK